MKRLLIFIVLAAFTQIAAISPKGAGQPDWLNGVWEGKGYQLNTNTTWTMRFEADVAEGKYTIEYPSLNCNGDWKMQEVMGTMAEFTEKIVYGTSRCVATGRVVVTRVDEKHLSFSYFSSYDGQIEAFSTLVKKE